MCENIKILNEIQKAVEFCERKYTQEEIYRILELDSATNPQTDVEKQICILKLSDIPSQSEANLLVFHLTNHHGLIREAVATKINEFLKNPKTCTYFQSRDIMQSLLKAVNDINPNICRTIIEVLPYIQEKDYLKNGLYQTIDTIFLQLEMLKRSNKYTKKLFNLYWCLEALSQLEPATDGNLEILLKKCLTIRDYTIREKTAYLINCLKNHNGVVEEVKKHLKEDSNYYVKRYTELW